MLYHRSIGKSLFFYFSTGFIGPQTILLSFCPRGTASSALHIIEDGISEAELTPSKPTQS